ncbi:MAG: carboxypeptidase-like regulatory domain-containing protein [Thermodesulfovibrionales bacterium]
MRYLYLGLMTIMFMLSGCADEPKTITGTVIDAETGHPVEGAVVLLEWTRSEGLPGLAARRSEKVMVATTGRNGRFTAEDVMKVRAAAPDVTVYKKGYVTWNSRVIFPDQRKRADFKWGSTDTFKMEHFRPEYSHDQHISFINGAIHSSLESDKIILKQAYQWEDLNASQEPQESWLN